MKSLKTIYIDTEVIVELNKLNVNVSELINNFLIDYLNLKEKNKGNEIKYMDMKQLIEKKKQKNIEMMEVDMEIKKLAKEIDSGKVIVA